MFERGGKCYLAFEIGKAIRQAFGGKRAAYKALGLHGKIGYAPYWRVMSHKATAPEDILLVEEIGLAHPEVHAIFSAPLNDT